MAKDIKNNNIEIKNRIKEKFSDEDIKDITSLGDVLRCIHNRLDREGYFLFDGKTWLIFKIAPIPFYEFEIEEGDANY